MNVLFIMFLVILGFTNAYIVLLRLEPDKYFQEEYKLIYTNDVENIVYQSNVGFTDVSSSNGFRNVFKAFFQVWFFIFGAWDTVKNGEAGDNLFLIFISMLFSLITVVIFFNLVM